MTPLSYTIAALLLLAAAFGTFRLFIRRQYRRGGRLRPPAAFLEIMVFFLWGAFTWIDQPSDWPPSYVNPTVRFIGWALVVAGLAVMLAAMAWLGFRRSLGLEVNVLVRAGPYRWTRNPQVVACAVAVVGYALLWLSWHTTGWVVLYAAMAHMMVLTEEEHLRNVYGEAYVRYRDRVARYLPLRHGKGRPPMDPGQPAQGRGAD